MAGNTTDARFKREFFRLDFVAHGLDGESVGADEGDLFLLQGFYKVGVLRQKAKAGMNRISARLFGCLDNFVDAQIALCRCRWANVDGFVSHLHMQGCFIGV